MCKTIKHTQGYPVIKNFLIVWNWVLWDSKNPLRGYCGRNGRLKNGGGECWTPGLLTGPKLQLI